MNWSTEWNKEPDKIVDAIKGEIYHKVTLSIPIEGEWPRQVEAWQIGDLAVHVDLEHIDLYQVTHVPTMTDMWHAVPDYTWSFDSKCFKSIVRNKLLTWCKKVQEQHKDDWSVLRGFTRDNYKSIDEDVLMRIKNWCLSVEVE
jgi:hypothetical protein